MSKTTNSFFKTIIANMSTSQNFTSDENLKSWAAIIQDRCLDYFSEVPQSSVPDNQEDDTSCPAIQCCVFEVPKKLLDSKPDAYTPKNVGLGPYHHLRTDGKQTPNQKLKALKNLLQNDDVHNFINMVERCDPSFEQKIRLCYDGHLVLNENSLAWIVIIDAIYLLHSIQTNSPQQGPSEHHDAASSNELFVRDLLMLENQIPICLIRHVEREFHKYGLTIPSAEIVGFCRKHSPFPMTADGYSVDEAFGRRNHMLDIMYHLILGREMKEGDRTKLDHAARVNCLEHWCGLLQYAVSEGKELRNKVIDGLLSAYKDAKEQGAEVPGILDKLSKLVRKLKSSSSSDVKKSDLPPVSQLHEVAQIKFTRLPSGFGLRAVMCDKENKTLYLPVMKLCANSEVILRNLMAYEAKSSTLGSEVIDFVEFMCKIIKDQNDVKILRSATIIEPGSQDKEIPAPIIEEGLQDEEIVELFNNLEKAIENTDRKKPNSIFSAIVDKLNKLFNNEGLVKAYGWMTICVVVFFKILTLLSPIFVFLMFFCEIYDCRRWGRLSFASFGEVRGGDRHPFGKASVLSLETHAELLPARKLLRY